MTTAPKTASTTSSEVRMTRRIVVEVYATAHEADLALQTFEQVAEHLNATARYGRDVVSAPRPAYAFTPKQLDTIAEALLYYGVKTTPPGQVATDCDDALCAVFAAQGKPKRPKPDLGASS